MKSTGLVFSSRDYIGSASPPSATLEDESRYGSDGTITTASWVQLASGLWVLDFNSATPDYVAIPAAATQLDFTSEDFSIVVAVYFDSIATSPHLVGRSQASTFGWYFQVHSTGFVRLTTNQTAAYQATDSATGQITTGLWYIIGVSRSGASVKLYKNGIDITSVEGTHIDPLTNTQDCVIGIYDNLVDGAVDGKMGLWEGFNYALSAEQHAAKFQELRHWFGV